MSLGINELKSLQTLSKIISGDENGFEINGLKDLRNLCGKISILGLEKVQSSSHAREANFSQKRLTELEVRWNDVFDISRKEMLEKEVWSSDFGDVFPCLQKLVIRKCPNLAEVSLGALPSLIDLSLDGCCNVVLRTLIQVASSVSKVCISCISGLTDEVWEGVIKYLEAVKELGLGDCNELDTCGRHKEDDLGDDRESNLLRSLRTLSVLSCKSMERCTYPNNIDTLDINNCSSITTISFPTGGWHKLRSLSIVNCNQLLENEFVAASGVSLLEDVQIRCWPHLKTIIGLNYFIHLTRMTIEDCKSLESFPNHELPNLTSLKDLIIKDCPALNASFPRGLWPSNLGFLEIGRLKKPISQWGTFPNSLIKLVLWGGPSEEDATNCSQLSLSHLVQDSSLNNIRLECFEKLESVSMGLQHLTSLQHLTFSSCPKMIHLPKMLLPSLLRLDIHNCPKLKVAVEEALTSPSSPISPISS
uniref:Zinc finger, CCHC-type n=1 Tax=Tanacetum cinerariifolium TaxID=118510 RepID=A0A6L2KCY0_TANCI|nr:zinc finger, CCHC-type [Tanacetum cinerariifolium]